MGWFYYHYGVLAESAEGARLLSEYTVYTVSRVRIPHTPPYVPLAQLDRVFDYESKGQRFESSRAHQKSHRQLVDDFFIIIISLSFITFT